MDDDNQNPLPAPNDVDIDIDHIMDQHHPSGNGGPDKDKFQKWMTRKIIKEIIEEAYNDAYDNFPKSINKGPQNDIKNGRINYRLKGKSSQGKIEIWVDAVSKIINSAYPKNQEERMKVVCGTNNFKLDDFYLIFDEKYFPYSNWTDFHAHILWDWLQELEKAEQKTVCDFRLDFMEGSHYLLLTKNDETVSVIGVYNDKAKTLNGEYQFSNFMEIILEAAEKLIFSAKEASVWNDDLDTLEYVVKKIKA